MKYVDSEFLLPFKYRDFTYMWIATLFSGASMWTTNLARAALVWNISESSNWVGLIIFALMIPSLLIPLIAGFIADWIGEGEDEIALDWNTKKTIIGINPRYFRPAEVDSLLGDATKAKEV